MTQDSDDAHLRWKNIKSEDAYDARIFKVRVVRRQSPGGGVFPFVAVDAPNWVTIVPELPECDGFPRFLVVRQYRHGTERVGMEFPAGMIDLGEEPVQAAERELREETGYTADQFIQIGAVSPNPAFMTNTSFTFLARGLKKVADQELDRHEFLDFHTEEFSTLAKCMGRQPYDSAITVQAWYLYLNVNPQLG